MKTNDVLKWIVAAFVLWYITTKTDVGQEIVGDTTAISRQLGVAEGLKSASQFMK